MSNKNGCEILVTGGAGFVGSNLALALQERFPDAAIAIIDDFSSGHTDNLSGFGGRIIRGDIAKMDLERYFSQLDVIFHQAAIADSQNLDRRTMFPCIVGGLKNVLDYSVSHGCKVIYASSSGVYGNSPTPMREGKGEDPINVYSEAKLEADNLATSYFGKTKGRIVGLRYFNIYGPGEEHKNHTANIIWQFYCLMKEGIRPTVFGSGEQRKDFIYIKDVITANVLALKAKKDAIVNIGTGNSTSFNEIVRILNRFLKKHIEPIYADNPYLGRYQMHTVADMTEAKSILHFEPLYDIEQGIEDYLFER
jgi:ADP-L-glycero-D-manno-heptose 6-epimerase